MRERTKNIIARDRDELIILTKQYVNKGYRIVGEVMIGDNTFCQLLKYENDVIYNIWNK